MTDKNTKQEFPTLKELQSYELGILEEFHKICEKHELKYVLDYGTLLGAVRHQGFIPWDDDVDVAMPRKDFEKFKRLVESELPDNFFFQSKATDLNYFYFLPKIKYKNQALVPQSMFNLDIVHGPWIDIFVYDYKYEDENIEANKQNKVKEFNQKNRFLNANRFPSPSIKQSKFRLCLKFLISAFIRRIQKFKKRNFILKYYDKKNAQFERFLASGPQANKSGHMMTYLSSMVANVDDKELSLNEKDFSQRILTKFESGQYYIPKDYDAILKDRYGDYHQLPPVEERISNHPWVDLKEL